MYRPRPTPTDWIRPERSYRGGVLHTGRPKPRSDAQHESRLGVYEPDLGVRLLVVDRSSTRKKYHNCLHVLCACHRVHVWVGDEPSTVDSRVTQVDWSPSLGFSPTPLHMRWKSPSLVFRCSISMSYVLSPLINDPSLS